ncbi:bifunctional phosphoribosylaminoimidazolecarboxamide formyltransferase/IMP cyclohydrolase [Salimicrobium humidisoli]|uniref:Bifunctional purine biosynthesis protein PurH n=1 Tax=Salimicrobium humidisoli TaxID=2029857 RepID=A0ABX4HQA2_9BACI|nr:bifunctional phosphoribosylaminoimidazolecarboxamide formyltransferase/IMP cyclohydrolase [Salimicrobium humidisoli]PBB04751.1 bifunctional phosphoribosylaminoimidazolecarboxamide formyltransferase/inosine monophosphate cyclohydrolase [Salimicrobium humidisoli]
MTKRALLSVSNKQGLSDFAQELISLGYELISTGGTKRTIEEAGIEVRSISEITEFPEIMDGRVKTLHPAVHSGLLARRDNGEHMQQLQELDFGPIDLVAVNLYPFKETIAKEDVTEREAIENVDIGGPTMLRSAAKNFENVTVVTDPADYGEIVEGLKSGDLTYEFRRSLAAKVFRHTAHYDALIAEYFTNLDGEKAPETITKTYEHVQSLRYGENPHQSASFYREVKEDRGSLAYAEQLHGKELSYNNIQDANAALEVAAEFTDPAAVAVKHMNPCGVGTAGDLSQAFAKAYEADPVSIFGGIVALNRKVDKETAEQLSGIFLEIIMAPEYDEEAFGILAKKKNVRILKVDPSITETTGEKMVSVRGGLLVQDKDEGKVAVTDLRTVTERTPTDKELEDLLLSWQVVKHVKSNAIVIAGEDRTLGVGAGQMNRVGAAAIALGQAGEKARGAVMASDAFFPMPDTVETAAKAGIKAIIQPGGSKRDQDSIDACNEYGIAMVFTGMRHFKH